MSEIVKKGDGQIESEEISSGEIDSPPLGEIPSAQRGTFLTAEQIRELALRPKPDPDPLLITIPIRAASSLTWAATIFGKSVDSDLDETGSEDDEYFRDDQRPVLFRGTPLVQTGSRDDVSPEIRFKNLDIESFAAESGEREGGKK